MSFVQKRQPMYALAAPMQIGRVQATTVAVSLEEIHFESPVAFEVGDVLDFSVFIGTPGHALQLDCQGAVTSCTPHRNNFRAQAEIGTFRIGPPLSTP